MHIFFGIDISVDVGFQNFCLVIPAAAQDRLAFADRDIYVGITLRSLPHQVSVTRLPDRLLETVRRDLGGR